MNGLRLDRSCSQRRDTPRAARLAAGLRLSAVADRAVMLFTNRRRPVQLEMSDHAQALAALRGLHKSFGWERVPLPDAGADALPADVRSDQSKAPLLIAAGRDENHGAWSEPT